MIRNLSGIKHMKHLVAKLMLGRNDIDFRTCHVEVDQRLMSGAMWTSSANGVLNLMIMSYLSAKSSTDGDVNALSDWALHNFRGLVEGDDGICEHVGVSEELIAKMGLDLKFDVARDFTEANFCGITCDKESLVVIKDPIPVLRKFFVLPARYQNARRSVQLGLLRSRALSYAYNFHDCPVIGALVDRVLFETRSLKAIEARDVLSYHGCGIEEAQREKVWTNTANVSMSSRTIVERSFGLSVDRQIEIENCLRAGQWEIDLLDLCSKDQVKHALNFTTEDAAAWVAPPSDLPDLIKKILDEGGLKGKASWRTKRVEKTYRMDCGSLSKPWRCFAEARGVA